MAAPVIESLSSYNETTSQASVTGSKPAGTANGDLLVAILGLGDQASQFPITNPSGWTTEESLGNPGGGSTDSVGVHVATKIAGASEPSTYQFSFSASTRSSITIIRISGASAVDASASDYSTSTSSSAVAPSVTCSVDDVLLLCAAFVGWGNETVSAPSGMTAVDTINWASSSTTRSNGGVAEEVVPTGATGTRSFTLGSNRGWVTASIAIAPAGGGGGTAYDIIADAGSFTATGTAATVRATRRITADGGSVALTGSAAALLRGYTVQAASGSFSTTGTATTLLATRQMGSASGSFAVTGTDASLKRGYRLAVDAGAYTSTGTAANLLHGRRIAVDPGAVTVSGQSAALIASRRISAASGSYALTGFDANLQKVGSYVLDAGPGSFSVSGSPANLLGPGDDAFGMNFYILARQRGVR